MEKNLKDMTLNEAVNENNIKNICVEIKNIDELNKLLEQFYIIVDKINNFKIKTILKYKQNQ